MFAMLTLHHLEKSRSHRILWLLEELGLDYELKRYDRDPKTMLAPKSLRELHPLGKSPVVTDGDRTLAESAHIIEYILDEYGDGRLRPERGSEDYLRYRYWMHYAEGSAMGPLVLKLTFQQVVEQSPLLAKPLTGAISKAVQASYIDREIATHMKFWDAELAGGEWFVGDDFTAADIQMSFPLIASQSRGNREKYPNVRGFVRTIRSRDAFQKAIEIGGPVTF